MIITVDSEIELRALTPKENEVVYKAIDENRGHLRKWLSWVDYMTNAADYIEIIQMWQNAIDEGSGMQLGIFYHGRFVGMCGYNEIFSMSQRGQIGYWIVKEAEGKGIVSRSVETLIQRGFEVFDLNRIEIICGVFNYRSRALPESLGFVKESVMKEYEYLYDHFHDCIMYRQLKSEYEDWKSLL